MADNKDKKPELKKPVKPGFKFGGQNNANRSSFNQFKPSSFKPMMPKGRRGDR